MNAQYVFIFESIQEGKATRLVHYEEMTGLLSLVMNEETKVKMTKCYNALNKSLKNICKQPS